MDFFFSYFNDLLLYTKDNFLISLLIYFIFLFFYSAFSLPGLVFFIALSGYLFGIFYTYFISLISITLGSLIFFLLSKFFFQYFFLHYYEKYTNSINKYISKSTTEYIIIFRMIPGTPLMLQNLILSLLDISITKFCLATLIGFTPIIYITAFIGNKIKDIHLIKDLSLIDLLSWDFILIFLIVIFLLFMKIKLKRNK